jgi:hypothetical protein
MGRPVGFILKFARLGSSSEFRTEADQFRHDVGGPLADNKMRLIMKLELPPKPALIQRPNFTNSYVSDFGWHHSPTRLVQYLAINGVRSSGITLLSDLVVIGILPGE